MSIMISPSYSFKKFENPTIDDLIDIFEDRLRLWVLNPAKTLMCVEHGQIAGFALILTYFEGSWAFIYGSGSLDRSRECFKKGFVEVFKNTLEETLLLRIADILYSDARCGFFHDGMFRARIYFSTTLDKDMLVTLPKKGGVVDTGGKIQSILINPRRVYFAVEKHFNWFISVLRDADNADARKKFRSAFKEQCDWESVAPVVGISEPKSPVK